jgi:hypothetical protein
MRVRIERQPLARGGAMHRFRVTLILAAAVIGGCSHTPDTVGLHGELTGGKQGVSNFRVAGAWCDQNPLAHVQLTFRNEAGTVIGTTTSSGERARPVLAGGGPSNITVCHFTATYSVDLPKAAFYTVQVEAQSPGPPLAFSDLESRGFTLDVYVSSPP